MQICCLQMLRLPFASLFICHFRIVSEISWPIPPPGIPAFSPLPDSSSAQEEAEPGERKKRPKVSLVTHS